jgi:hypothetical protein
VGGVLPDDFRRPWAVGVAMGLNNVVKVLVNGELRDFVSLAKEHGLRRDTIYERWRRLGKPEVLPPEALRPPDETMSRRKATIVIDITWGDGATEPLTFQDMTERFHEKVGLVLGVHAFRARWVRRGSPLACNYKLFLAPLNGTKRKGAGFDPKGTGYFQETSKDMSDLSHLSDTPTSEQFERLLRIPMPTNYEERL